MAHATLDNCNMYKKTVRSFSVSFHSLVSTGLHTSYRLSVVMADIPRAAFGMLAWLDFKALFLSLDM